MLHGRYILISIGSTAIACIKSAKLSVGCGTIEIASATSAQWQEFIAGRKDWSMSCSCLLLNSAAIKSNVNMVGQTYTVRFGDETNYETGSAICTQWEAEGTVGNLATGSFQFKGSGALT